MTETYDYLALPIGDHAPEIVVMVIEATPTQITKYDKEARVFRPVTPVYTQVHYPGSYGFIPQTISATGAPLGILMLSDGADFPGRIRACRPLGLLELEENGVRFEKIIACAADMRNCDKMHDYSDLEANLLREIEHILAIHRDSRGVAKVLGWKDQSAAQEAIRACHARFIAGKRNAVHTMAAD